jgi:NAD+ synthase
MTDKFRLTLAQLNPTVGALEANAAKARKAWEAGRKAGADMVALTEMFITGYQTRDLVMKPAFYRDAMAKIEALAVDCADGPALGVGGPYWDGEKLFNAYWILQEGKVAARVLKHHLPNDTVFDEVRLFSSAPVSGPYRVGPLRIGTPICEDAWHDDVTETLAETGAEILLVPNGSPYFRNKYDRRVALMVSRVIETKLPLVYLNMVGAQDDQIFDGASFVLNPGIELAAQLPAFDECIRHVDFECGSHGWRAVRTDLEPLPDEWEQDYRAMVESLRDYLGKNGIAKVLLGLSGGIDSALVAALATDALGAGMVRCVMMPSDYTSAHSLEDAAAVAQSLGCRLDTISIEGPRDAIEAALAPLFKGTEPGVAEENIQSRTRGLLLMALSNKFGEMLLTTGNKSEMAVGYATIYGDMAGGYNPLKDLYKTRVFQICRWRNDHHRDWMMGPAGMVIPPRVIDKPPSAELRENQTDQDSLPPYEVLDAILERLVEGDQSVSEVVDAGFDRATVKRVEGLLYGAEWKRYQCAPGIRLTQKAFWLDRRYPMVNRWRDNS